MKDDVMSPRVQFPSPGVPFDVRSRARTIIWPLNVWAAERQWDSKDKCLSINKQVEPQQEFNKYIRTYIVTAMIIHQQWHFQHHSQRQQEAFTNIGRYVHSLLLINFTGRENYTYRLAVHIRHTRQSTHIQSQACNHSLQ